jgi:hypothetical protein
MSGNESHITFSTAPTLSGLEYLEEQHRNPVLQKIEALRERHLNEFIASAEPGIPRGHVPFRSLGQNTRSAPAVMQAQPYRSVAAPIVVCQYQPLIDTLPVFKLYGESPIECLEFVRTQSTFPWETLKPRLTAETWEALVLLYHHIDKTRLQEQVGILAFAVGLILLLPPCEAECRIGKLLYALDNTPDETIKAMNCSHAAEKLHWIDSQFNEIINSIRHRLDNTRSILQETGFRETEQTYYIGLTKELAEILLTSKGEVNCSLREFLMIEFMLKDPQPTNHQKALERGLKNLTCDDIRGKIQQIKKPLYNNSTACHLIRLHLNMERDSPISDLDAKKTALAASLSHLRQGSVGSCFATSIGIVLLNSFPEKCFDDFGSLLSTGKLVRTVDGISRDFPFLMRMSSSNIDEKLILNKEGFLHNNLIRVHHISALPGIAAACRTVGIEDAFNVMTTIVAEQFVEQKSNVCKGISIYTLLKKIADYATAHTSLPPQHYSQLYHLTMFAYESQVSNPLLKAWENSLAEMSEGKDESMITPSIHYSLLTALKQKITKLTGIPAGDADNDKVLGCIKDELGQRLHLHYDPNIQNATPLSSAQQNKGGFLIYDTKFESKPLNWTRIDNPKTFQEFVSSIIENVKEHLVSREGATFKSKKWDRIFTKLSSYVDSDLFISKILTLYYPNNSEVLASGGSWRQMEYTPWRTICGNIAQSVLEVYTEQSMKHPTIKLNPNDAELLLATIINMLRDLPEGRKKILREDPFQRIPIYTLPHAFSLLVGHPTLIAAMDSPLPTNEWIEENLFSPEEILISPSRPIVHIADTNWSQGMRDLHIGICVDPLSHTLKLMNVFDDDSSIIPIQEPEMFLCDWELMENPYDILPIKKTC